MLFFFVNGIGGQFKFSAGRDPRLPRENIQIATESAATIERYVHLARPIPRRKRMDTPAICKIV